jgi:arylsulfatase A-like enzyme
MAMTTPDRPLNVVLLGVDSLRAGHMSAYGYPRLTTPHLDVFARQGVLFENHFSGYIPTPPGYTAMLTGRDLISSGVVSLRVKGPLDPSIITLPRILGARGYASASVGFEGDFFRGFGFDEYAEYRAWMSWEDRPGDKAERLNEVALPILDRLAGGDRPFLLFLRHMDPHAPYLPPPPFDRMFYSGDETDPRHTSMEPVFAFAPFAEFFRSWMPPGVTDAAYVVAQYDGALAYMDACIQRILTRIDELGIASNTIVVLTADHGETLTEHDCYFDHHGLYEPTLRVPLAIRCPGLLPAGQRVRGMTLEQDLVPTLLDLLGVPEVAAELGMEGRSALDLVRGVRPSNYAEFYISECTWMRKRGWRTAEWKLIEALEPDFHGKPPLELYNLVDDPGELSNLAEREPQLVKALQERMTAWLARRVAETGKPDPIMDYHLGTDLKIGSIQRARDLQAHDHKK